MINIIPKPYVLKDFNARIYRQGFKIVCPQELEEGLEIFKDEFSNYLAGNYVIEVKKKKFNNLEAYKIMIDKKQIIIEAGNPRSLFYATRSLKQLINEKNDKLIISCCEIFDKPKFSYRSFSLDDVRHFAGVEEVKKIIDILSLLKIRYLHWHLSDDQGFRVNFKKFPKLYEVGSKRLKTIILHDLSDTYDETPYQYCYEEEEILDIIEYAKKHFISVIPEFDTPGHTASMVASYPYLHCLNQQIKVYEKTAWNADILCPSKETTYEFLDSFYEEVMCLFKDCEYIHLGGDEVIPSNWEICPDCQNKMHELGITDPARLQDYFSNRLIKLVRKYNKKLIMWADGIKDDMPEDIILQYWTWRMEADSIERINAGRPTIYSPCSQDYFDAPYVELPLKTTYGRGIVLDGLTKQGRANIIGMECNMWREFIRENKLMEFMMFPRIHAFSESCWTHRKNQDYIDFKRRLKYHNKILDQYNMVYAKEHLFDRADPEAKISYIYRHTDRYIEFNKN